MEQIPVEMLNDLTLKSGSGRGLTTTQREDLDLSHTIKGWGSDLDPRVRPGVPMDKAPHIGVELLYPEIEQQVSKYKVHKSIEHGKMTPVFGNACPPKGLSGLIRDHAFKFSEGKARHWLYLVLADRVDMIEVLFKDIFSLNIPNIPKEIGMKATFKYDRRRAYGYSAAALAALAVGGYLLGSKRARRRNLGVR